MVISYYYICLTYYRDIGVAVSIMEFHQVRDINLIVIITYYCDLFKSFPFGRMLNYQLLTTYYRDIDVAVCVKEFHQAKGIKLIVIITYFSDLFEFSFRESVIPPTLNNML